MLIEILSAPDQRIAGHHRFLKAFSADKGLELSGLAAADEIFFLESFRGQRELPRPASASAWIRRGWHGSGPRAKAARPGSTPGCGPTWRRRPRVDG